jgi:DNA invertase Pin-like site-specific DNA recombinase
MERTIGYIRVSTDEQAESGLSLESQRKKVQAYCDLYGLALEDLLTDTTSGKSINGRPAFKRLLFLAETNQVEHVVILKLDRMARNTREAIEVAELFASKGVNLHSVSERIDTSSAGGRLFFTLMAAVAQWEREVIVERTKAALDVRRQNGQRISGQAPYGFRFDEDGGVVVDWGEQGTIETVKALRAQGLSLNKISEHLKAHGFRNRNGNGFDKSAVSEMLKGGKAE